MVYLLKNMGGCVMRGFEIFFQLQKKKKKKKKKIIKGSIRVRSDIILWSFVMERDGGSGWVNKGQF